MSETFIIKIGQLPEEKIAAAGPRDAAKQVADMIAQHPALAKLPDDAPVAIKRADRTPWGRNLTLGVFRHGPSPADDETDDGPQHRASI